MKIIISSFIAFFFGAFLSFVLVNSFSMDEIGRKDQLLFTLMRIISENGITIQEQQASKVIERNS